MMTPQPGQEPKTPADLLPRILEIAASPKPAPAMPKSFDEKKKRRWLDKWLNLQTAHHPDLLELEDAIWRFCADYARNPARGRRMLIHGNNGAGKSHCARAVCRWANRCAIDLPLVNGDEGPRLADVTFLHWPRVVDRFKPPHNEWWVIDDAMRCSLLIIDDIGAEHDPSRVGIEKLYLLLERREFAWTLLTTNITPEAWEERFERRISSRFLRNFELVSVEKAPDFKSL